MSDLSGLRQRRTQRSFASWDGYVPPELVALSEEAIRQLIDRLIDLGKDPTREQVQAEISACVQRFNELDEMLHSKSWIFTIEREDIGEVFYGLIKLCGFKGSGEWLRGREW